MVFKELIDYTQVSIGIGPKSNTRLYWTSTSLLYFLVSWIEPGTQSPSQTYTRTWPKSNTKSTSCLASILIDSNGPFGNFNLN